MKSRIREDAEDGMSMAAGRASDWADRSRDAIDEAASAASSLIGRGRNRARYAAESARDWATDAADVLADQSSRGLRTTTEFVRAQPLIALGATLAVGLLVGFLLSRDD
jgi:ElaB/YqjD/DUF883 family membrane-anchored ribosome-binding protein